MKHQPYKAISHRYACQIHKRSNILMTIKLSTTNSVNKTLQHKALWDLKHYIRRWRQSSWLQLEGAAQDFSSERSTGLCMSSGGEHHGSGGHCHLSDSVNATRSKHIVFSYRDQFSAARTYSVKLWSKNKEQNIIILGPS